VGGEFEMHLMLVTVVTDDGGPHLTHAGTGHGGGSDRAGPDDVGRWEKMEEALLESLHAAGSEGGGIARQTDAGGRPARNTLL
jgi:hypothetical protein